MRSWTACHHLDELTTARLGQLRDTAQLIAEVTGQTDLDIRQKRGLFDFVGKVSKMLFGTLDGDDAQYYNEQIEHFEQNSNSLTRLLRQQLTVVRSTLGAVNDTLVEVTRNEERMREGLVRIQSYVNSMAAIYGNVSNLLSVKITLESHLARVLDGMNALQRYLDIILSSLVDAQQGILHPQIISPYVIVDSLLRDSPYFPPETSPPVTLSRDSAHVLYKLCDVHIYIHKNVLEYVIVLPLVNLQCVASNSRTHYWGRRKVCLY